MKTPVRLLQTLIVLLAVAAASFAAEPPPVRAGNELDFRPYSFTDASGRPTGFGVELLREVGDRMGLRLQFAPGEWDTVWNDLVARRIDVLPVVARTPGREPLVDFSLPHTETFDAFFVRAGRPPFRNLAEATGREIVVLRSDAAEHQLAERKFAGQIIPVDSIADGLRRIAAGRHDAFLCSKLIGVLEAQQADIHGLTAGPPIPDYKRVFSFAVRKGNPELLEKLNQGLRIVKSDGTYDRLYRKWLDVETTPPSHWHTYFWRMIGVLGVLVLIAVTWVVAAKAIRSDRRDLQGPAPHRSHFAVWAYALAVASVAAAYALRLGLEAWVGTALPAFITFFPAVIVAALMGGVGPGLAATALAAVVLAVWVLPPIGHLAVSSPADRVALPLFCMMGLLIAAVAELHRRSRAKAAAFDREEALRETRREKEFLANLIESANQPFAVGYLDGRLGSTNRAFERLTGYTAAELRTIDWSAALTPPEWRDIEKRRLEELDRTGQPVRYEKEYIRKDGTRVPVELFVNLRRAADGQPGFYYAFITDITERKRAEQALREQAGQLERARQAALNLARDATAARRQAEQSAAALRESEARIQQALNVSHSFTFEWLPDTDEVRRSASCGVILNLAGDEAVRDTGRRFFERIHSDDRERFVGTLSTLTPAQPAYTTEYRVIRGDGSLVTLEETGQAVFDAAGRLTRLVGVSTDITVRRQAEAALKESEARFRLALKNSPVIVAMQDAGLVYRWAYNVRTRRPDEIMGKTDADLFAPEDLPAILDVKRQVLRSGQEMRQRLWLSSNGQRVFLDCYYEPVKDPAGRIVGIGIAAVNLTEQMTAEAALRESEEKYRNLFDNMVEEVHFWRLVRDETGRIRTWRLVDANPPTLKTWGRKSLDEIRGKTTDEIFGPGAAEHYMPIVQRIFAEGAPHSFEDYFPNLDKHFRFTSVPLGEFFITTGADITAIKKAEAALRDLNATLEQRVAERTAQVRQQADQLRALATELTQTEMRERQRLAKILHDHIQQLLVGAQMQLSLVKRGDPRLIQTVAQGVHSILAEALTASRSLTVELCPPILHQSGLVAALSWLSKRMEQHQQFNVLVRASTDAEPATPEVRAFLFDAVREVLLNSLKHSGARDATVTMLRTPGNECRIIVEDAGKGFDPAAVTPGPTGGFGLFSIQQRLLYMGGRMEIESAPGRGMKAVMTMPIGDAAPSSAPAKPGADPAPAVTFKQKPRRIRVLLADDHRILRQGLASLLQFENDIEIAGEAENGREAVESARRLRPDVVIMDVNMPEMDGIVATKLIMDIMPQTKVIALSMHFDRDAAEAMREAGATAYLTKGGPSEDLVAAIRACGAAAAGGETA